MNIGTLIRGLLGQQKPGDAKTLDMKPGQVVRGVVMSLSEDGQEAVVQIQGVQVRAKLETPLRQGETALLQVQAQEEGGTPVLKPLTLAQGQVLSAGSMNEALEFAGMLDTKENRELLRALQMAGVPLTKENLTKLKEVLAMKPPQVPAGEWSEAAAIAFHRGLPVTPEGVRGLHQAVFGPPLHQLLQALEAQVGQAQQAASPAGGQALLAKLQGLLVQLRAEPAQLPAGGAAPPAHNAAAAAQAAAKGADVPGGTSATAPPPSAQAAAAQPLPHGGEPWVGRLLKLLGAEHEQQVARAAQPAPQAGPAAPPAQAPAQSGQPAPLQQAQPANQVPAQPSASGNPGAAPSATSVQPGIPSDPAGGQQPAAQPSSSQPAAAVSPAGTAPASAATTGTAAMPAQGGPVTTAGAAQPGAETEGASAMPGGDRSGSGANAPLGSQPQAGPAAAERQPVNPAPQQQVPAAANPAAKEAAETLKGLLLHLAGAEDVPPALKETVQQVVQHLTGQQLLLNTDRTAPFAQVTLFIPLQGPNGEQTASVHIQSRRGRKGELDAKNCRLWFDLDMKHLGHTVVDVNVVEKIVSLHIRNDQEWTGELFESKREELAAAVESIGYQLFSLKSGPLPDHAAVKLETQQAAGGTTGEYTPQVYKGVDVKI